MLENKQLITIKGTRDGLTLFIDDSCSFSDVLEELAEVISMSKLQPKADEPNVAVTVQLGYRYLHQEQKEQLFQLIGEKHGLVINGFESEVIQRKEALKWKDESEVKVFHRIVRSGQVLKVNGDLLLVGDVNPSARVVATGNIYILGHLRGIAHAGSLGDQQAVIVASYMNPSQLRIADHISRAPDYESTGVYMECGLIDEKQEKIIIDRLQVLSHMRTDLSGFERRMKNG